MIPILIAMLLTQGSRTGARDRDERTGGRTAGASSSANSGPVLTLAFDYTYPFVGARVPLCTDDATCLAVCGIGVVTGSTSAWQCRGHDGLAYGVVTDPGGTVIDSFLPGVKARVILGADAPSLASAPLATALSGGAHTVIAAGMARDDGSGYEYWFADSSAGPWLQTRNNGSQQDVYDGIGTTNAPFSINKLGYGISTFMWNGTTGYTTSSNFTPEATTQTSASSRNTITSPFYFGTRSSRDLQLSGPAVFFAFYSEKKSAAQLAAITASFYGTYASGGLLDTGGQGTLVGVDNTSATGNVDVIYGQATTPAAGQAVSIDGGLIITKGFTNVWAVGSTVLAGATDVGTPVLTNNVSSGPFAAWLAGAECDLMADDDAAALEGKQSAASAGTTLTYYHQSAFLKAGTTGTTKTKALLAVVTDGTMEDGGTAHYCDIQGLTSTAGLYDCSALIGGSPTFVKGQILVGNAASDTGSIQVCQGQTTKSLGMAPPQVNNTPHGDLVWSSLSAANWNATGHDGEYDLVHTPVYNPLTTWVDATSAYYALDVSQAGDVEHVVAIIFGYTVAGRMLVAIRGPAGESGDLVTDGVGLTPGQPYDTRVKWTVVGANKCLTYVYHDSCGGLSTAACRRSATTLIASDTTGTSTCPGTPAKVTFGDRFNLAIPGSAVINHLGVLQ